MGDNNRPAPPWAGEMEPGDFISAGPTYEVGTLFYLFDKKQYRHASGTELKYYFYDPLKHLTVEHKKHPLLVFLHGTGNALEGDICINYTGAELYASSDYQKSLGGAYILIPVANEYRDEEGRVQGAWSADYLESVHGLIMDFVAERKDVIGPVILLGNSSGATFVLRLMDTYMDDFDVVIPVGGTALAEDAVLDKYDEKGKYLFMALGKRDELHSYSEELVPRLPKLESMKHCFVYTPDWVRNGDKGVASIYVGVEIGQHCLMNAVQVNLMFDDGTPMDGRLPNGLTGWIADVVKELGF